MLAALLTGFPSGCQPRQALPFLQDVGACCLVAVLLWGRGWHPCCHAIGELGQCCHPCTGPRATVWKRCVPQPGNGSRGSTARGSGRGGLSCSIPGLSKGKSHRKREWRLEKKLSPSLKRGQIYTHTITVSVNSFISLFMYVFNQESSVKGEDMESLRKICPSKCMEEKWSKKTR